MRTSDRSTGRESRALEPFALAPVFVVAGAGVGVLLIVAGRYGYHRDELYFLACAGRLAWGFVDQPPLTPAIAKLAQALAPGSVAAPRVVPALLYGTLVVLTALTARELGAGRTGQVGSALCTALSPGFLLAGHLLSTATPDLVLWGLTTLLLVRLIRTREPRWWPAIGLVVGVGLENKWSIGFLVVGLLVGLLLTPERRSVLTPWFLVGVGVALAVWSPNLVWQARHGWPQLSMFRSIQGGAQNLGATIAWLPFQFLITGPVGGAVWVAGLLRLLRDPMSRPYRSLAYTYLTLAIVLAIAAGNKQYYVAGLYVPLFGAGGVPLEGWLAHHRRGAARPIAAAGLALTTVLLLLVSLPILPARTLATVQLQNLNPELGEQIGWPALVLQVDGVWRSLEPSQRVHGVIFTSNYGEAGAIDRFGPALGLPRAYSGHNTYWWWGPPPDDTQTVVVVGFSERSYLLHFFGSVRRVGTIRNGQNVQNDEEGLPIWLAMGPRVPWSVLWPELRHYD